MKARAWVWRSVLRAGFCAALLAPMGSVHGQAPHGAVAELVGYHLDGGGQWRQDNPEFEPGGDVPAFWVRHLEWGPARDVVRADAFAVYEDRRCEPVAHMVYYWDIEERRVAVQTFNAGGVVAKGYVEALGPSEVQLVATIRLPDGGQLRIRDRSDRSSPDEYTSRAERWVDGTWVEGDVVTWRVDPSEGICH